MVPFPPNPTCQRGSQLPSAALFSIFWGKAFQSRPTRKRMPTGHLRACVRSDAAFNRTGPWPCARGHGHREQRGPAGPPEQAEGRGRGRLGTLEMGRGGWPLECRGGSLLGWVLRLRVGFWCLADNCSSRKAKDHVYSRLRPLGAVFGSVLRWIG